MNLNIQTERLILRRICEDDFAAFAEYYGDPEVCQALFGHTDVDDAAIAAAFKFNMGLALCFSIVLKSTGEVIGNIHFVNITGHYLAEIGCILHPRHQARGYMTEAFKAAINFVFNDYGLAKIRAMVDMDNAPSVGLVERCGFIHEATLREAAFEGRVADVGHFYVDRPPKEGI